MSPKGWPQSILALHLGVEDTRRGLRVKFEKVEERSRRRVRDLVTQLAFEGLSENEIGRARISMMANERSAPRKGRIQKRKTNDLQIITFGLQRAARSTQMGQKATSGLEI